ncbi:folate transporter 1-like isoform X2 [Tribolium madens]|uniref:folate transporter 1-like isoform X2 n=1 Tax=Tribolium madens TaxID=41895 RepID=UPI001CF72323|nr:folate transporter 1-like isoform X2 [Tribolium madens]
MHFPVFEMEEPPSSIRLKISWFKTQFSETFANKHILKWSLWSGFSLCGYVRISALMESLWKETQLKNDETSLNIVAVDGISAFFALIGVLLAKNATGSAKFGNALLCITSVLECVVLLALSSVDNVWTYAVCDLILEIVYQLVMASVCVMIAQRVEHKGNFALVFSFIGVIFAISNLVFICVFNSGSFTLQKQLMILAGFHFMNGVLVVLFWLLKI